MPNSAVSEVAAPRVCQRDSSPQMSTEEVLHVVESRADPRLWLARHGVPRVYRVDTEDETFFFEVWSRYILEQTPLKLIVYDPRSNRLETVTELSILDRIKVSSRIGYNVFGTASAFWQDRISALNANAAHRMQ